MLRRLVVIAISCMALGTAYAIQNPVLALQGGGSALKQMLDQVPDSALSRTAIWYGAPGDLTHLMGIQVTSREDIDKLPAQQRVGYLFEIGLQVYYSPFSGFENSPDWNQTFGINSFAIDRELTAGAEPPNQFGILEGKFQSASIVQHLQPLGYQPTQIGSATVYSLGADNTADPNNPAQRVATSLYNRLVVSDAQIIAAPSTAIIQAVVSGGKRIGSDPVYAALANALEGPNTVPGTQLLSGVLFDGAYLAQKVISPDWVAQSGLSKEQLGLQNPLPSYKAAGIGYRRNAQARALVIALVYADAGSANQASTTLVDRLGRYMSLAAPDHPLFAGWKFNASVVPDGAFQVLVVTSQMPYPTDVSWVKLASSRDMLFLAAP
jgi:hypothetical protein